MASATKRLKLDRKVEEKDAQTRKAALPKSIESFTTDLYKCIADHEKRNFVCSGLSVHLVLSMCALGAQGNTAKKMLAALHLDKDNLSNDFKNLVTDLAHAPQIELNVVNRIFAGKSIVVKDSFKQDVNDFFLSDVVDVDFASEREKTVKDINDWCAKMTKNKIQQILSTDDVDSLTRMILTNAVYFKARWMKPFSGWSTTEQPFFINKDTTIDVPTMHLDERFMYNDLIKLKAECITIPYKNSDYVFVIIKPKEIEGLEQLESNLHAIDLDYCNDFEYTHIRLSLPKFKIESKIDLNKYLPKLGMAEMFTAGKANFKGISEEPKLTPPLYVDKVFQKALIEVDEEGTEAAAVTYAQLRGGGGPSSPIQWRDFRVDRPFLYKIVKSTCNLTLFSGRVVEPTYN